jgi:hypothetical protein
MITTRPLKVIIIIIIIIIIMQNIAADSMPLQSQDSWADFSICTTVAVFVLISRTAHKS